MQSLQLYVEEHQLDVRPGASLPELTVAVAQYVQMHGMLLCI